MRLALLAALAGEHVLLDRPAAVPPRAHWRGGCTAAFAVARCYFERLLTRFSTPEELFGPLSLKALEEDRYERLTDGFLPTAGVAFLDEVFKANSAILNALLTLLNEREFDNGAGRQRTPLVAVVAASNEVPSDEALHAFFDRFLLRVPVAPVGRCRLCRVAGLAGHGGGVGRGPTAVGAGPAGHSGRGCLDAGRTPGHWSGRGPGGAGRRCAAGLPPTARLVGGAADHRV